MNEIYLREAITQLKQVEEDVSRIHSLVERVLDEPEKWCSDCCLPIRTKEDKCPCCGNKL